MKADLSPSEGWKSSILTEPGLIRCRMEIEAFERCDNLVTVPTGLTDAVGSLAKIRSILFRLTWNVGTEPMIR